MEQIHYAAKQQQDAEAGTVKQVAGGRSLLADSSAGIDGPSREALLKVYDEEEADALIELERKLDGSGEDDTAPDPEAIADAVSAAVVYTNGS